MIRLRGRRDACPTLMVRHKFSAGQQRPGEILDARGIRVQRPPQGYRWVKDDDNGDLILAALVGGLIATIISNN